MEDVSIGNKTSPEANWNRQTGRQADRQTDRQTDRQAGRQSGKPMCREAAPPTTNLHARGGGGKIFRPRGQTPLFPVLKFQKIKYSYFVNFWPLRQDIYDLCF